MSAQMLFNSCVFSHIWEWRKALVRSAIATQLTLSNAAAASTEHVRKMSLCVLLMWTDRLSSPLPLPPTESQDCRLPSPLPQQGTASQSETQVPWVEMSPRHKREVRLSHHTGRWLDLTSASAMIWRWDGHLKLLSHSRRNTKVDGVHGSLPL